jgi:hypothetical protein
MAGIHPTPPLSGHGGSPALPPVDRDWGGAALRYGVYGCTRGRHNSAQGLDSGTQGSSWPCQLQAHSPTAIHTDWNSVQLPGSEGATSVGRPTRHPLGRCLLPDQVGLGARGSSNATMGKWIYAPRKAFKTQNPQNSKTS